MSIHKLDVQEDNRHRRRAGSVRLQLVLPVESVNRLDALKEATEASSYAEVLRRALRIYEGLLAETQDGGEVFVKRRDGVEEKVPLKRAL
jgi:hypothetical protein